MSTGNVVTDFDDLYRLGLVDGGGAANAQGIKDYVDESLAGAGGVLSQAFEIEHADILTLPSAIVTLKPATETYNYASTPTEIFIPVAINLYFDIRAGAYTNVDEACEFAITLGSDGSLDWSPAVGHFIIGSPLENARLRITQIPSLLFVPSGGPGNPAHLESFTGMLDSNLQDNAIALRCTNAAGDFSDGHADNTIKGEVLYTVRTF